MNYYSTNNKSHRVSLKEAVLQGLAPDQGLYMPEQINLYRSHFLIQWPTYHFRKLD